MSSLDPDGTIELVAAILAGTPNLPGAVCDRRENLFDPAHPGEDRDDLAHRHNAAATLCRTACPVIDECAAWLTSFDGVRTSYRRPAGVLAGRIPQPAQTAGRPRKERR